MTCISLPELGDPRRTSLCCPRTSVKPSVKNLHLALRKPPPRVAQTSTSSCTNLRLDLCSWGLTNLHLGLRKPSPRVAQTFASACANLRLGLRKPLPRVAQTYRSGFAAVLRGPISFKSLSFVPFLPFVHREQRHRSDTLSVRAFRRPSIATLRTKDETVISFSGLFEIACDV